MGSITLPAYAKINISLDVTGRRPDGYHTVEMIMQTLSLKDLITVESIEEDAVIISCSREDVPVGPGNLCYKAALLMKETFGIPGGFRIHIDKHIPMAAGMAGGSSDAAAVLKAINSLSGLNASLKELELTALKLGADVPYMLYTGPYLSQGIGEILTPLKALPKSFVLTVTPECSISTKDIYEAFDALKDPVHPDTAAVLEAIDTGSTEGIIAAWANSLEAVTAAFCPEIATIKQTLSDLGAAGAMMSGSGPTVFALFNEREKAEATLAVISRNYSQAYISEFIN
ncbi:MAG: 4-(cytidine 5'-diphospho)-2-C-methyl-D-erythritol kinase [Parasporobacterium sp.]|nr:4-(cytidine 5'-diphospho)-2-C-methyl-D-erythritol kinase [Parasporobacterium sp.]